MKTIAISRSLEQLKYELENLGYEVFFEDDIKSPMDIFIYSKGQDESSLYLTNQLLNNISSTEPYSANDYGGTLLINGYGKSLEEIRYIIENKLYSPIF